MFFKSQLKTWRFLLLFLLSTFSSLSLSASDNRLSLNIQPLDMTEMQWVGSKIYENECASKPENLIHWGVGEAFPSLGIGHFIWYPKGFSGPYHETFPEMVAYVRQYDRTAIRLLEHYPLDAPWLKKDIMLKARQDRAYQQLQDWLLQTKSFQAMFIVEQFEERIDDYLQRHPKSDQLEGLVKLMNRLLKFKEGRFALIDYTNFKGIGNSREKYNGEPWGLISVLLEILKREPRIETANDEELIAVFVSSAKHRLRLRVSNAPQDKDERRWLKGWFKRLDGYNL